MSSENIGKLRIPHEEMQDILFGILRDLRVPEEKAKLCSEIFTSNSLDGVYSHGINRFSRFVDFIERGIVKVDQEASCISKIGGLEQWHGQSGIGITNAIRCTERATQLAASNGVGCVALSYTNHWMRAGTYARKAIEKGYALVAWSNTIRNTPAWGSVDAMLGNNPLTIGVPFDNNPVVLDMAMSQFSYGVLEEYQLSGKTLPVAGGFDQDGNLTSDPTSILKTRRTLPIGYWKGSGLSLVLDILAATLANGLSVSEVSKHPDETNVSQVFIAFDLKSLSNFSNMASTIQQIILELKQSTLIDPETVVKYPGESAAMIRNRNLANGIPVNKKVWEEIMRRSSSRRIH